MSTLSGTALDCVGRGWYVFPCKSRGKEPLIKGGFHAATNDPEQIREWWTRWPDANVGIATGASGLTVLDIDTGLSHMAELTAFSLSNGLPHTYLVRTGRRPGVGLQLYFQGGNLKSIPWSRAGLSGDIRSGTGYVLAAGSIHPSGEPYTVLVDAPIAPTPAFVRDLRSAVSPASLSGDEPIREHRNSALTSIAGKLRNAGLSAEALRVSLLAVNTERCDPPMSESEVERIAANASRWPLDEKGVTVTLGKKTDAVSDIVGPMTAPVDWRTRYTTFENFRDAKPPTFLIRDFLEDGSITALGAPVAQRKSIVVANVIRSLLTGEPLFGHFEVVKRPDRILYLCPEMGLVDVANRFKRLGLEEYVGKTLFIRTMDDPRLPLAELDEELPGSLLVLDTLTRFVTGNQNDAGDMAKFADVNYALRRKGATIMLLHHAIKGAGSHNMTLDSALRGSTELAAFVTCVWSTQLQDADQPHKTPSNLKCVKQRGFESEPFQVSCDEDFRMTMLGSMGEMKSQKQATSEAALAAILKESPGIGINKIQEKLRAVGHRRGAKWVTAARMSILGSGVKLGGEPIP